jgi:hypothetical protein
MILAGFAGVICSCGPHRATQEQNNVSNVESGNIVNLVAEPPPPEPTTIDGFQVGHLVADLYGQYDWCYDYNSSDQTCSQYEAVNSRSSTQIQIRSRRELRLEPPHPNSVGDAVAQLVTQGTTINPDGIWVEEIQTFEITPEGLCHTREQDISDAYLTNYRWISNFGPNGEMSQLSSEEIEQRRRDKANARSHAINGRSCWRYTVDPSDNRRLTGSLFIDGIRQSRPDDVVYLADKTNSLRLRVR